MDSKIGVLVFPAGEINSVELHDALSACVNIRLVGASSIERHGEYIFENYYSGIPKINEYNFIDYFNELINKEQIDIVIPTHDDVALYFAENKEKIHAKILTADLETAKVCRDKKLTYDMFENCDFCPKIYDKLQEFPVFIKPRRGQGSVGTKLIMNKGDITQGIEWSDYVICEYLPGEEWTVDCFTNKDGVLSFVMPRSRQRTWAGVSVHAQTEELTEEVNKIAETINNSLVFVGLWYFQIKRDKEGNWKLLEVSSRCAGTMCLSRAAGANLPLLSVYTALDKEVQVFTNDYKIQVDRTLISRYRTNMVYKRVYIDLDDTILVRGKVHLPAVWFLYQCMNEGKEVILLTRHSADHDDTVKEVLKKHKIMPELFSQIIEMTFDMPKYKVMESQDAIFIDNAYVERMKVHEKLGIPVFDVDGLEVLMDWRR